MTPSMLLRNFFLPKEQLAAYFFRQMKLYSHKMEYYEGFSFYFGALTSVCTPFMIIIFPLRKRCAVLKWKYFGD
jgi:hypothetical protein